MSEENQKQIEALRKLQAPFKPHEISLLPKQMKKDDQDKGRCEAGSRYCADGRPCGGYHARSIHLDYVGHAALTKRLLEVDPLWTWEPVTVGEDRLPHFDKLGGLWIKLTVCGHSRLGYGDSQGKTGNNAIKEAIGDALRNAGMRFGMALELWHKGDLYDADELRGLTGDDSPSSEPPAAKKEGQAGKKRSTFAAYPDDKFTANLPAWRQLVESEPAKAGAAIAQIKHKLQTKYLLTDDQVQQLDALMPAKTNPADKQDNQQGAQQTNDEWLAAHAGDDHENA